MKGTVKWFNANKGFGFILGEDEQEYFVHWNSIQGQGYRTLVEQEPVEFQVAKTDKGLQATEVIRINQE